ncbi:helix-hairpin-helix domain-containing protein [Streptomyces sp. NPDC050400]|uniref:helix-hairpin-helix domain-containing protein n=1 Tax=Streptomyces sp. NPDC050400 TaxID=3365610 RepID=UPI0037AE53FE
MALRSLSRTAQATSGPGRGPASDSRARQHEQHRQQRQHRRGVARRHMRRRRVVAEETRLRAEALFAPPGRYDHDRPDFAPSHESSARDPVPAPAPVRGTGAEAEAVEPGQPPPEPVPSRRARAVLALRDRLPVWVQTRCGIERRGAVALTVLLGVAALFAVQHFWAGRTEQVRAPQEVRAVAPDAVDPVTGADGGPAYGGAASASSEPSPVPGPAATGGAGIVVDVSGKVRRPGIHRLPAGARVADALRAAGGATPGADTTGLNRARLLMDGEQVLVGAPAGAGAAGAAGGVQPGGVGAAGAAAAGPIGLNTATVEQLDTLPGVGPVLAQHIVDYRTEHGGFRSVDELREVNGIGDRRFEDLQNLVRP